ncbi:MAG TPA: Hpt domain-containing protein [Terriglobales bacterium]|nr:Hpt domain-containing protein [Terriglobales bacterium]
MQDEKINENIPIAADAWNKAEAIEWLGGDEELLRELVEVFIAESRKPLLKLRDAVFSSDADGVVRGAHSIKGELGCLGAIAAANTAQKLQTMGINNEMSGAPEMFRKLEREMQAIKLTLVQWAANCQRDEHSQVVPTL